MQKLINYILRLLGIKSKQGHTPEISVVKTPEKTDIQYLKVPWGRNFMFHKPEGSILAFHESVNDVFVVICEEVKPVDGWTVEIGEQAETVSVTFRNTDKIVIYELSAEQPDEMGPHSTWDDTRELSGARMKQRYNFRPTNENIPVPVIQNVKQLSWNTWAFWYDFGDGIHPQELDGEVQIWMRPTDERGSGRCFHFAVPAGARMDKPIHSITRNAPDAFGEYADDGNSYSSFVFPENTLLDAVAVFRPSGGQGDSAISEPVVVKMGAEGDKEGGIQLGVLACFQENSSMLTFDELAEIEPVGNAEYKVAPEIKKEKPVVSPIMEEEFDEEIYDLAEFMVRGFHDWSAQGQYYLEPGFHPLPNPITVCIKHFREDWHDECREAFAEWETLGFKFEFIEDTENAHVLIDDEDKGAFAVRYLTSVGRKTTDGLPIVRATGQRIINVSKLWPEWNVKSTMMHEVGHVLGFGHVGPYNGTPYPMPAENPHDNVQNSIMSYYGRPTGKLGPADRLAIKMIYGDI